MIHRVEMLEVTDAYPAIRDLPLSLQEALAQEGSRVHAPAGKILFDEGGPCTGHALILHGSVRIFRSGGKGREIGLHHVARGELCGVCALALLGGGAHSASGSADGDVDAVLVPKGLFLRMVDESPSFRTHVFHHLAEGAVRLMSRLGDVAFRGVDQRLAMSLLAANGSTRLTHRELANELACTREAVSRVLERFARKGLVRLERGRVSVLNPAALRAIAEDVASAPTVPRDAETGPGFLQKRKRPR